MANQIELVEYLKTNTLQIGDSCINHMGISVMIQSEKMIDIFSSRPHLYKIEPRPNYFLGIKTK